MMKKIAFIYDSLETLLIALIIGLLTVWVVKAENKLDAGVLNGLFTPTQSERFFETGRENFEREIQLFTYPEKYLRSDMLQIDTKIIEQMDRGQFNSDYDWDNSTHKLRIDILEL
ncbi:MAG: hypothetical protein AAF652_06755 [Cyanobacteria bacterium P01_C01_bin.72]